ncbi:hypothetical protein MPRG_02030 [Mycobacterium paragordonae]|uniref:Uncharacterized protein n=1 Tax=Mycobacterium paragordonae TaxID=1389713 RepID=A0ABQ1BXP7_9MYCO|nr:hypothetical protein MPRG_02030 [Mycobacterium paragordonae]
MVTAAGPDVTASDSTASSTVSGSCTRGLGMTGILTEQLLYYSAAMRAPLGIDSRKMGNQARP